jgi:CMP-N-acetylneuraminic acid synthetase
VIKGKNILAIIPARGGSKRLPRKNILPLAGKPLIAWTIEAAIDSKIFDDVMVNTDDQEIAEIAAEYGAVVPFIRPDSLASDTATSLDMIKHTLQWYRNKGIFHTDVVLLQPTSPLRTSEAIIEAWKLYIKVSAESVVSICLVEHPIQWTYRMNIDYTIESMFEDKDQRSQDYEKNYRLNGAVYIIKASTILERGEIISSKKNYGYLMSQESSVDIDSDIDFQFASFLLQK